MDYCMVYMITGSAGQHETSTGYRPPTGRLLKFLGLLLPNVQSSRWCDRGHRCNCTLAGAGPGGREWHGH